MKKTLFLSFIGLIIVFSSCNTNRPNSNQGIDKIEVRLKWTFTAHTASGPGVALEKGFFKEENIDADINPGGFEFDPIQLVASGSEDFGIKGADDLILARSKGVPIVAIAMDYQLNPVCFMTLKESNINEPKDFIGKRIGCKYGQNTHTFYKVMLKKQGIDESQIEEVAVQFDPSPLLTGQIDIYQGYANFTPAVQRVNGLDLNVILARDYGVPAYGNVVFTTEKMIKENPDLVERFLKAYMKGWEYAIENQEETARIMNRINPKFSYEAHLEMLKSTIPYLTPTENFKVGTMELKGWEQTQEAIIDGEILENPIDLSKAYTNEFLERIYK